jgi:GxxExxY protein
MSEKEIHYADECYVIQGSVFEVYREMGCGFLEPVYQECLERELSLAGIPFRSQVELTLSYKGEVLQQTYIPDFICFEK